MDEEKIDVGKPTRCIGWVLAIVTRRHRPSRNRSANESELRSMCKHIDTIRPDFAAVGQYAQGLHRSGPTYHRSKLPPVIVRSIVPRIPRSICSIHARASASQGINTTNDDPTIASFERIGCENQEFPRTFKRNRELYPRPRPRPRPGSPSGKSESFCVAPPVPVDSSSVVISRTLCLHAHHPHPLRVDHRCSSIGRTRRSRRELSDGRLSGRGR